MSTPSSGTGARGVGRLWSTHPGGASPGHPDPGSRVGRLLVHVVVAALLVPLWFAFLAPRAVGGPLSMIWVSGTSMEPTLSTGDLAVLYRADAYEVGDIVAFDIPEGGTVIHRVIEVTPDGHRFQGDNRDFHDPWVLPESQIHGRQVLSVPQAARVMSTVGRPEVLSALVVALVVFRRLRRDAVPSGGGAAQSESGEPASAATSASKA
jgi:signal peptidase I